MKAFGAIAFHSAVVTLEYEDQDPDIVPFAGVAASGEIEWYTADELRELADKMDVWQNMNHAGGA